MKKNSRKTNCRVCGERITWTVIWQDKCLKCWNKEDRSKRMTHRLGKR